MNATCQTTVNCLSGCVVRADWRGVELQYTHTQLTPLTTHASYTHSFSYRCVKLEEVMGKKKERESRATKKLMEGKKEKGA